MIYFLFLDIGPLPHSVYPCVRGSLRQRLFLVQVRPFMCVLSVQLKTTAKAGPRGFPEPPPAKLCQFQKGQPQLENDTGANNL